VFWSWVLGLWPLIFDLGSLVSAVWTF
jgi:hypothetical protein